MKLMNKTLFLIAACVITFTLHSCSKKTHPAETASAETTTASTVKTVDSAAVIKKPVVRPKPKPLATVPKVIVVNDASAKRSVDGRLYYDLEGHRYWRSNKDGKYYLYNKSMNTDEAFKASSKKP